MKAHVYRMRYGGLILSCKLDRLVKFHAALFSIASGDLK